MTESVDGLPSFEQFEARQGTDFAWLDGNGGSTFSLVEAQLLGDVGTPPRARFALVFAASDERATEQGTYRLRHPLIGTFDIFLVPIATGTTGLLFEAIFS